MSLSYIKCICFNMVVLLIQEVGGAGAFYLGKRTFKMYTNACKKGEIEICKLVDFCRKSNVGKQQ